MNIKSGHDTNNFDFLRLLAALGIVFTHSFDLLNKTELEPMLRLTNGRYSFSSLGTIVFFSISGYLIPKSLDNSSSYAHFLWKRFLRIQPLLFVVIMGSIIFCAFFTILNFRQYFTSLPTWTYLRNLFPATGIQFHLPEVFHQNPRPGEVNGSLWTLVLEERLYLLISFFFFFNKSRRKLIVIPALLFNLLSLLREYNPNIISFIDSSTLYFGSIFLNASIFYYYRDLFFLKKIAPPLLIMLIAIALSLITASLLPFETLVFPFLILSFVFRKTLLSGIGKYGDFTYGIYIWAFPVQQIIIVLLGANELSGWELCIYTLIIIIPLAIASWNFIEKPMLKKKGLILSTKTVSSHFFL